MMWYWTKNCDTR